MSLTVSYVIAYINQIRWTILQMFANLQKHSVYCCTNGYKCIVLLMKVGCTTILIMETNGTAQFQNGNIWMLTWHVSYQRMGPISISVKTYHAGCYKGLKYGTQTLWCATTPCTYTQLNGLTATYVCLLLKHNTL